MELQRLTLTNFKNYEYQELEFSPRLNCFAGLNGMGKTNLLDAIYYICMGKSHTGLVDGNIARHEQDFFRIEAHFRRRGKPEKVVAKVQPRRRKVFERNDTPYQRLSEHIGLLPVVIIVPDDTHIILDGSEVRRRFLDNTLSQLDHRYLDHLITYTRVLSQRNAALKQFSEPRSFRPELIQVYDQQLLEPAQYIFEKRQQFIDTFRPRLLRNYEVICGQRETVDLAYLSQLSEQPLQQLLADATEKDRILQRTTVGIHKDDLELTIEGHPLKRFASQGQLKSYVLALKLGQYEVLRTEKNIHPLLLLDDIFDKLDQRRVAFLLELLTGQDFGQVFMTDTHQERLESIVQQVGADYCLFRVENGRASLAGRSFETPSK